MKEVFLALRPYDNEWICHFPSYKGANECRFIHDIKLIPEYLDNGWNVFILKDIVKVTNAISIIELETEKKDACCESTESPVTNN